MEDNKINIKFAGNLVTNTPAMTESDNKNGYVTYGEDNKFGDYLWNLYTRCSTEQAIVDSICDYTCNYEHNSTQDDIEYVIDRCIFDYVLFGGFALQVNEFAGKMKLRYIDFKNIRTDREKQNFFYSQEWGKYRIKLIQFPAYNEKTHAPKSIYYFTGFKNRDGRVYPIPRYSGAIQDIETNCEISNFWASAIQNNLSPSAIISFNNGIPSEEVQHEIEKAVNKKFSGSTAAARTLITFNDNAESAPRIERLAEDNFDQKYQSLVETIQQRIFTAFRCNPMLAGINYNSGFNAEEFKQAYDLFYITVILPIQKVISREFEKFGIEINFKKLEIYNEGGTGISDSDALDEIE